MNSDMEQIDRFQLLNTNGIPGSSIPESGESTQYHIPVDHVSVKMKYRPSVAFDEWRDKMAMSNCNLLEVGNATLNEKY